MHITTISFHLPLKESQIPLFKQAILDIEGLDHSLYNNKINATEGDEKNLHRYPPIHYRVFDGNATLWGINEGAKCLEAGLKKKIIQNFFWQGRQQTFQLVRHFTHASETASYTSARKFIRYRLSNYLPLSNHTGGKRKESSYTEYEHAKDFTEKIKILERIVISHLLLFSYGAGWQLTSQQRLKAKIVDMKDVSSGVYKKGAERKEKYFKKFDLIVDINAWLPDGIAIGNQVSLGYGVVEALQEEP